MTFHGSTRRWRRRRVALEAADRAGTDTPAKEPRPQPAQTTELSLEAADRGGTDIPASEPPPQPVRSTELSLEAVDRGGTDTPVSEPPPPAPQTTDTAPKQSGSPARAGQQPDAEPVRFRWDREKRQAVPIT